MLDSARTACVSLLVVALASCGSGAAGGVNQAAGRGGEATSAGAASSGAANGGGGATAFGGAISVAGRESRAGASAGGASASGAGAGAGGIAGAVSGNGGSTAGSVATGGAGGRGPAPTFTRIYDEIITPSCGGTQCHLKKPTPYGYDFSSKAAASASWRADVIAGDGQSSPMFQVLNFGIMPKDQAQLSVEQLYLVLDWIDAGALDD